MRYSSDPACMIDPEAYDMVFRRGLMPERTQCEHCSEWGNDMVACCDCDYTRLCADCAYETGTGKHRCVICEDERLDRLQGACRLIGAEVGA